jgi:repressor of nif and glnA expression
MPLASKKITKQLHKLGYETSERTVRLHLLSLDKEGLTCSEGKSGRMITENGIQELMEARVFEKVGYLSGKIDQLSYNMTFDITKQQGTVIINVSLIKKSDLGRACPLIMRVFDAGYAMGRKIALFNEGNKAGEIYIPEGYAGIGTVCSISMNGVLLKHGVPVFTRFGGLLQIINRTPKRFLAIINYDGTSLVPLDIFIRSDMTNYLGAISSGNGVIGSGLREVPNTSRFEVQNIADQLTEIGFGGVIKIGMPGQHLMEVPINEGRVGMVVIGGLNPIAILKESGFDVKSYALSCLMEFEALISYRHLKKEITGLLR